MKYDIALARLLGTVIYLDSKHIPTAAGQAEIPTSATVPAPILTTAEEENAWKRRRKTRAPKFVGSVASKTFATIYNTREIKYNGLLPFQSA
jgi:hypothetical protein